MSALQGITIAEMDRSAAIELEDTSALVPRAIRCLDCRMAPTPVWTSTSVHKIRQSAHPMHNVSIQLVPITVNASPVSKRNLVTMLTVDRAIHSASTWMSANLYPDFASRNVLTSGEATDAHVTKATNLLTIIELAMILTNVKCIKITNFAWGKEN